MSRSYGALSILSARPLNIFTPDVGACASSRAISIVMNLPVVKDQGDLPVCPALVALTMYEQLLLRENMHSLFGVKGGEMGWAWIYLSGREIVTQDRNFVVEDQLLTGLPLVIALDALINRGVLIGSQSNNLHINDPVRLQKHIHKLNYTPMGTLAVPLRYLAVLPTSEALHDVILSQYVIGFVFGIDANIDRWMHSKELQEATSFQLPDPPSGAPRLATHAAVITAIDMQLMRATVQNSFGLSFGTMGFFFVSLHLLLRPNFSNLEFYVLTRAG